MTGGRSSAASLSRRSLLLGGGALVLGFTMRPPSAVAQGETGSAAGGKLPGSLVKAPFLDAWIRIDVTGGVTVFTGKAELGQGIKTAFIQVAAEELVVAPKRVAIVTADTARTADEGYTAGSHSMQDSGTAIRHAAAQVRVLLAGMAALRLAVPVETLQLADGVFTSTAGATVGYGALVEGQTLHVAAAPESALRPPAEHTVIGRPMQRVDIPAKVSGGAAYIQDLRWPDMVHGRVVRPPSAKATLQGIDTRRVLQMPGVLKIVRDGRFIGVVARGEYQAVLASRALAASITWAETATLPTRADLFAAVLAAPSEDDTLVDRRSSGSAMVAVTSVHATYRRPLQMHGSIGPSCAVARMVDGQWTVWTHTQGVFPLRKALAQLVSAPLDAVHCIHVEGSGCYGHNGADDVAADAILMARAWPGVPVRVQWMREDEHGSEPLGPAMVTSAQGSLDGGGRIAAWNYELWSAPHSSRPGTAGDLLAGSLLATPIPPSPPQKIPQPEGGGDRNAIPIYRLPALRVVHHFQPHPFLRTSALRSLGAYFNIFSIESFVDEMAQAAQADPVVFRLSHLDDPRAQAVVRLAAERFGWNGWKAASPGRGRGFAFARYKNLAAYAAIALEVDVQADTGEVRVLQVVAVVDCGEVVNPDGVRNQIEGGVVQSASWTLMEEVTFDTVRVTSRDWGGYPILRFGEVPLRVDVHIIDQPGRPFLGVGEASQGPTGAAIANAVVSATGMRFRDVPLDKAAVRRVLQPRA